jgi:DNA polymerase-3 subunit alpha
MPDYVHLDIHTEYSLIDSIIRIDELAQHAKNNALPAVGIADRMNLFALIKAYSALRKVGLKPIIGVEVVIADSATSTPFTAKWYCQNEVGYRTLTELISRAYLERDAGQEPCILREWIYERGKIEGIIMLSGGLEGDVGQLILAEKTEAARDRLAHWAALFPSAYYIELSRVGKNAEARYDKAALSLSAALHLPVVATHPIRFMSEADFMAHEARVCIREGRVLADAKRPKRYTKAQYFYSVQQMKSLFADIPEALQNSVHIAERCNLSLTFGKVFLPNFPIPQGLSLAEYFALEAKTGLHKRFNQLSYVSDDETKKSYEARLAIELAVITRMGFEGYFLIVADFIKWSKTHGIPVGPGRGSGAGSLVAYALEITGLDPIYHGLLFERFLNPERISMPDFDIDFCMEGRDRVIEYVIQKYGKAAVSQIITYGTMAAKAVVRDVGRVLAQPYGFVDKLAKLIPFELEITLDKALLQNPDLLHRYQKEEEVKELIDLAKKLEGITRNVGKHAGGVVIAPSALTDFTPLYVETPGDIPVSQFDKDDIEAVGLVKFDFLGLRTLTIIDWAVKAVNKTRAQKGEPLIDIETLPLDDPKPYALLQAGNTTAIFQFESRGMKDLIKRFRPTMFSDIVDLGAIFRPGPLQAGMVDDFIERKRGRAAIVYEHPLLESVLKETCGVIIYQEQVMKIAQVLAGYTLGGADILRRAMGKKKPEEMAKQRAIFVAGAMKNTVAPEVANHIFDLMEKFAGYGFNKSHSAAYAVLSYQTAWLKAHYPAEFMAAVLSSDMDNTDKVVIFYQDTVAQGCTILVPDINVSEYYFTVVDEKTIRYGLGAIKGAGRAAIDLITIERKKKPFTDLVDFCMRLDLRKVNKRVLEALIKAGAFDSFGFSRASYLAQLNEVVSFAEKAQQNVAQKQHDLFGTLSSETSHIIFKEMKVSEKEILAHEKAVLGLYLSGHPIHGYRDELKQIISHELSMLDLEAQGSFRVAGYISDVRNMVTKRGDPMAIIILEDSSGSVEFPVFSELYQTKRQFFEVDTLLYFEGDISIDKFSGKYRSNVRDILSLDQLRSRHAEGLLITLSEAELATRSPELKALLAKHQGGSCKVAIDYKKGDAVARIKLGDEWKVRLSDDLLHELRSAFGNTAVSVVYRK